MRKCGLWTGQNGRIRPPMSRRIVIIPYLSPAVFASLLVPAGVAASDVEKQVLAVDNEAGIRKGASSATSTIKVATAENTRGSLGNILFWPFALFLCV